MTINPLTYVKESTAELGKVIWPTRGQTMRLTLAVVIISVIVGAYIAGIDAIFAKLSQTFLIK